MNRFRWLKHLSIIMGLYQDRISECYRCPEIDTKLFGAFCKVCGCNMKVKARVNGASCPLGKWKE